MQVAAASRCHAHERSFRFTREGAGYLRGVLNAENCEYFCRFDRPRDGGARNGERTRGFIFDLIYLRRDDAALKSRLLLTMQPFAANLLSDLSRSRALMAGYANPRALYAAASPSVFLSPV